jgi:hypothetical protein
MVKITSFQPQLASLLPETCTLLASSNLTVHPAVSRIVLHGSRGLANNYRVDSDIDLSLIVDMQPGPGQVDLHLLQEVWDATLNHWNSGVELDLALVFDTKNCGLKCFDQADWDSQSCTIGGKDCFGLYKLTKGFSGLVTNTGIQVRRMIPCLKIWERVNELR